MLRPEWAFKSYFVAIDANSLDAFAALGKRFGYRDRRLVEEGLNLR